jgi:hypothetical protein
MLGKLIFVTDRGKNSGYLMNRVLKKSETFISGELIISDRIPLFTPT